MSIEVYHAIAVSGCGVRAAAAAGAGGGSRGAPPSRAHRLAVEQRQNIRSRQIRLQVRNTVVSDCCGFFSKVFLSEKKKLVGRVLVVTKLVISGTRCTL